MTAVPHAAPAAARLQIDQTLVAALAGLLAASVVLFAPQVMNDGDTFWHLAAGERMLAGGRMLTADVFSHTRAGAPWVTHEWLSEVVMALGYRAGGWAGLLILFAATTAGAFVLLGQALGRWLTPLALAVTLVLVFACVGPGLLLRPHLLVLPLLIAWCARLIRAADEGRPPPLAYAALMALWANLHGSYAFGLALAAPLALEAVLAQPAGKRWTALRRWAVFGLACGAAALATPHGITGLLFPLQVVGMESLPNIVEWRPTDFSQLTGAEAVIVAAVFVCLVRGVKVPVIRVLILLGLLHMTLQHARHEMLFGLVGALLLARPIGATLEHAAPPRRATPIAALVVGGLFVALCLVRLALPVERPQGPTAPIAALAQVPKALAARPVFNDYGMGGYLIFQGVKVYADGRADMYGDAFLRDYFRAADGNPAALDAALKRHDIAWTLLQPGDAVAELMDKRPGWRRLYADRWAVVHVRAEAWPQGRRASPPPSTTR